MDADGRHQRRLTSANADARDPVFDRAGKRIVYTKVDASGFHLWMMRADGSGKRQITKGASMDFEAAWSPDGKRVAFGSDRGGVFDDLWVVSATGQGLHRVRALTGNEAFPDWKR
jgi:Tol biopolymer transport system component